MTGRELAEAGMVSGASGNISVRQGKEIIITAGGSSFAHLTGHDLTRVDLQGKQIGAARPSVEKTLHVKFTTKEKMYTLLSIPILFLQQFYLA